VYPQKQQYAYAGYPPQHYPPGPYYHSSQYGPYNYWGRAQLKSTKPHNKQLPLTISRDYTRRSSLNIECTERCHSSNCSLTDSTDSSYEESLKSKKDSNSNTNPKPNRLHHKSNLSMIDEDPSMTNHYKSTSFIMTSRSDPSLSSRINPRLANVNECNYVSLNRHAQMYEVPVKHPKIHQRRYSASHPYFIERPYNGVFQINNRHTIDSGCRKIYQMPPPLRPNMGPMDRYYNMPPIVGYNNLYLAFLYWPYYVLKLILNLRAQKRLF